MPRKPSATLKLIPSHPAAPSVPPPAGLDEYGAALWTEVTSVFEWDDPSSYRVLAQAAFAAQRAERCRRLIDEQGEMLRVGKTLRSHPLLRDEVANRALCCRLLARLGMDVEPIKGIGRPPGGGGLGVA
jgi:hypothetical protein